MSPPRLLTDCADKIGFSVDKMLHKATQHLFCFKHYQGLGITRIAFYTMTLNFHVFSLPFCKQNR